MDEILPLAVKNGLISLKNVAEGALPGKMHQGPPDAKAAPGIGYCYRLPY